MGENKTERERGGRRDVDKGRPKQQRWQCIGMRKRKKIWNRR